MKNKVYYGEYTLKHWIRLMLREEIVLPEYQRHFVWSERDAADNAFVRTSGYNCRPPMYPIFYWHR